MELARVVVIGSGVFGTLAAEELRARGHDATNASRRTGLDLQDVPATMRALERADAVLHTAGPFHAQAPSVARAAAALCVPYVDVSDDRAFSAAVAGLDATSPILTGMSTTPALAEALAALVRARGGEDVACAMYVGGANRQGPATMAFAARSRAAGPPVRVDFPGVGARRAYPAHAFFDGPFHVAVGGLAGLGWRSRVLLRALAPIAARLPRVGRDTAGALVVMAGEAREALHAREGGQRLAVLPAVWAMEEALAGRTPPRPALPRAWVDPEALVGFLARAGFTRTSR